MSTLSTNKFRQSADGLNATAYKFTRFFTIIAIALTITACGRGGDGGNGNGGGEDSTPPTISSTDPASLADGAADVDVNTTITATFNEPMDTSTITSETFILSYNPPVSGTVSYDSGANTATFTPDAPLMYSTTYTATITAGATDAAGNPLDADYSWFFTTETTPESDITPPATTASPADGTYGSAQSVELSCNDGAGSGCAATYYTTGGSEPTASSTAYSGAITIDADTTLKFFSVDNAGNEEPVNTEVYVIEILTPTYIITASAGANGNILPSAGVIVSEGGDQSFNITPNAGYSVADVSVDGASEGAITAYTFTNVTENHTISATFGLIPPNTYTVGGSVSGLTGSGLVLQNNGGDNLSRSSNGSFTFTTPIAAAATYAVTVSTQPSGQTCSVTSGSGTISGANVTNVAVDCVDHPPNTYTVGGSVSGLTGSGLVLQNNGGDDLTITADGSFTFATPLVDGATYAVTVSTQPSGQTCSFTSGSGTISGANVTNVAVDCVDNPPNTYTVGGSVSGLTGSGLVLQNNGGDDLTITADGSFTFATPLVDGATYAVTVSTQPSGQTCAVTNDSGTIIGANVTNVSVSCSNNSSSVRKVPDTGQTPSYTATFGEDSDYTINPPSYTDNGDGTVTDNVTTLMWQQEDDNLPYNWYEATGTADATHNLGGATDVCGSLTLAGYTDWRLPSNKELMSIVNYDTWNPAINSTYFLNTTIAAYWSSTEYAPDVSNARDVGFSSGVVARYIKAGGTYSLYVRCVRGEQYPAPDFTDNGDDTVTDNVTTLMWQKEDDNTTRTWEEAITYCEGLSAGYTDWRLPNVRELESIVDYSVVYIVSNPTIYATYFPNTNIAYYWSSTTGSRFIAYAWNVNFAAGGAYFFSKTDNYYVRCVRLG